MLVLVCAVAGTAACGGDDDGGGDDDDGGGASAICGDGRLTGDEECDGTSLGANDCTTAGDFAGGELACTTDCTLDTSGCTADAICGNGIAEVGEDCDGDALGDATCASVGVFTGGELACADDCSFDTSGCESDSTPSGQIAAARAATDGTALTLPIDGAMVTYIRPAVGNDPAGVFVQAEQAGPALFVAVAPADLDKALAVGDTVSFTVTAKVTQDGQPRATAVTGFTIDASGGDVDALVQDASAATLLVSPAAAPTDDYDSELIVLDATVLANFAPAGGGHEAAAIATPGIPSGTPDAPRFRLEAALRDSLDLAGGCILRIGPTPLWRFQDVAQPSIWAGGEVAITSCNPPRVTEADASAATTVTVTFDRRIDPASVQPGDFTFTSGLSATAAAVGDDPRQVTVTTTTQTAETAYVVTVAGLTDTRGAQIDGTADSGNFTGFGSSELVCDDNDDNDNDGATDCFDSDCALDAACDFASQLYIWEIDPDQDMTDTAEFIEIANKTGATVDFSVQGWYVLLINGSNDLMYDVFQLSEAGSLAADGVWVIGNVTAPGDQEEFANSSFQNGQDGVLLVRCDACAGVADFAASLDVGNGPTFTTTSGATATKMDGIAYGTTDDPALQAKLNVIGQFDENALGDGINDSLQRTSVAGWAPTDPSPGDVQ